MPPAAAVTYVCTAPDRFFVTLEMKYWQNWEAETQPSVSTQIRLTLPPAACAAAPAPRPAPPATGKITSAPCWMNVWLICRPLFWSVNEPANVPPFWSASFQPSTWTFLPFCLL